MKRNTVTIIMCLCASAIAFLVGYGAFVWGFNNGANALGIKDLLQQSQKTALPSWVTNPEVDATPILQGNLQVTLHRIFLQGN